MGLNSLVPVEEALHVDDVADLKVLYSAVNLGGVVAEVRLNNEGVGSSVVGSLEVQVVAVYARAVPSVR